MQVYFNSNIHSLSAIDCFQILVKSLFKKDTNYEIHPLVPNFAMKYEERILKINGPHQANLVLVAYASSKGSGEPAHPRSLARTFAARSYKQ